MNGNNFLELLYSKKFITAIIGVIAVIVGHYMNLDSEQIVLLVTPLVSFILGQGIADYGKSAAKWNYQAAHVVQEQKKQIDILSAKNKMHPDNTRRDKSHR